MKIRNARRSMRQRATASTGGGSWQKPRAARQPYSPRAVMLFLLLGGPVLLICLSFFFGVGLQATGLINSAMKGGLLGGLGSLSMTVLMVAFFCLPGYLLGVTLYIFSTKNHSYDVGFLKKKTMSIPLTSLLMGWVPSLLIPDIAFLIRVQVAIVTMLIIIFFGFIWVAMVRMLMNFLLKIGAVEN